MKTCARCGKNVSDGTSICPNCSSVSFYTDKGLEGGITQILMDIAGKGGPAAWVVLGVLIALLLGMIGIIVWVYTEFV